MSMKFIVFMQLRLLILLKEDCAITSNKKICKSLVALRNFGQLNKGSNNIIIPGLKNASCQLLWE